MKDAERIHYHAELWPAACAAQKWNPKDEAYRRAITRFVMEEVRAPITDSTTKLGRHEVTALFTYLRHIANPDNISLRQRWEDCKADYIAFGTSTQADYWQRRAFGGAIPRKLIGNRFAGRPTAQEPDPVVAAPIDRETADQRRMTMRAIARSEPRRRKYKMDPSHTMKPPGEIDPDLIQF